ncbi:MAG: biotin transporter BioY [Lachnospiraceae bacterium]|nr:biotin transporter BioY [Lachnospiraceae bacterium]
MSKKTHSMVMIAMFGAIISIISAIPTGINILGVPATLQTFAIALTAYTLGYKKGSMATLIYILLGVIGLPVFGGFKGGLGVLMSVTGGFIVGFVPLSILLGFTSDSKNKKKIAIVSFIGLALCYIIGVTWFALISKTSIITGILIMVLPYLSKDIISMFAAYVVAKRLKKSINLKWSKI